MLSHTELLDAAIVAITAGRTGPVTIDTDTAAVAYATLRFVIDGIPEGEETPPAFQAARDDLKRALAGGVL